MFFNKDKEIERLRDVIEKNNDRALEDKERTTEMFTRRIERAEEKHADEIARMKANEDVRLMDATADLKKQVADLTAKNAIAAKEVEMFTKAFENLGFDVKDMKEILNKLVDGIVAKGQIQLIKA